MRLLELRSNDTGTRPAHSALLAKPSVKPVVKARTLKAPPAAQSPAAKAPVFPLNSRPPPPARRVVDLVQLQQRIEQLEKRIQQRLASQPATTRPEDIEQLQRRMKQLEQRIETELWSARQREHDLLQLLARQSLLITLRLRGERLLATAPATLWHWSKLAGRAIWNDIQPMWWPRFAAAWQQAWDKAQS